MSSFLKVTTLAIVVVFGIFITKAQGRLKRCYNCRSRGELGDCKDPFEYNATIVEGVRAVEAAPCASGWCAKVKEGDNSDFDTATERMCVQRPPTDGEERCSDTIIDKKPVYMCFCQGDLCNASVKLQSNQYFVLLMLAVLVMLLTKFQIA